MAINLYKHNAEAWMAARDMLEETGKAAVVHPTGTGKSFIGFKLCEEYPEKTVCWLSPSEYIYRTQIENLKKASDGWEPENVRFFTYARLMNMTEEEISEIRPEYIVLDEFHRCGAEQWGLGVQKLLQLFPIAHVLGLSATAIRYLDNQRNMAEELFDGNIASEMTLGDAIVRGVLNPPTYVLSVFAYQQDYDRIKARVRRQRNKAMRDEAEKYLDALRRALDMADGLDVIFDKHMKDRHGKYIVFCSNLEHMREMMGRVGEWFGKVDPAPHVYYAYSDDPATSRAFADFKGDNSDHLKLLFTIDMLNEGIHVDDVNGVILFRPTISPIIYKQQIGRALSASKGTDPVIFDIVNNIENLYSIGTIVQEMRVAVSYYRMNGEAAAIVNERFRVIDEVRNAWELFDQLNDTLSAPWETMYGLAKEYYEEHGNLEVPFRYKTKDGYSLGNWVFTQRKIRNGEQYGSLSEERIEKLDRIGMVWEGLRDLSWKRYFEAAEAYCDEHGDLAVNVSYVTKDGLALGTWISSLRDYRKNGAQQAYLTEERILALDSIGMIWSVPDYMWEAYYAECLRYYREHGNLEIPSRYVSNGLRVGNWINRLRGVRKGTAKGNPLTEAQISRLDEIGMIWESRFDASWEKGFSEAERFFRENHHLEVPMGYLSPSGYKLGRWILEQRGKAKKDSYPEERRKRLETIGMVWSMSEDWDTRYAQVKAYYEAYGNLEIPDDYKIGSFQLANWLKRQRADFQNGKLTAEQVELLQQIGFSFSRRHRNDECWQKSFEEVKKYLREQGDLKIPKKYKDSSGQLLYTWLFRQRKAWREGKLDASRARQLRDLGADGFEEINQTSKTGKTVRKPVGIRAAN